MLEIDIIFKPLCLSRIYKQVFFKNLDEPELTIHYFTANYKEEQGLALSRVFTLENQKPVVYHELFKLPYSKRGLGISKLVFQSLLQQYVNIGVRRINVHASLTDGGYVWAKHFFTAILKEEVSRILKLAEKDLGVFEFNMVKRIFDNYYKKYPDGTDFPINKWAEIPCMKEILRGSDWHGSIDLNNSEQFNNFISYVFR